MLAIFRHQIIEVDGVKKRASGYTTDWYTDRAIDFIEGKNRDSESLGICGFVMVRSRTVYPAERHRKAYPNAAVPEPTDIYPEQLTRKGKPKYVRERNRWVRNRDGHAELIRCETTNCEKRAYSWKHTSELGSSISPRCSGYR